MIKFERTENGRWKIWKRETDSSFRFEGSAQLSRMKRVLCECLNKFLTGWHSRNENRTNSSDTNSIWFGSPQIFLSSAKRPLPNYPALDLRPFPWSARWSHRCPLSPKSFQSSPLTNVFLPLSGFTDTVVHSDRHLENSNSTNPRPRLERRMRKNAQGFIGKRML